MKFTKTGMQGLVEIEPKIFGDERGQFLEFYRENTLSELGLTQPFVQENLSTSRKGVLRGLHFQKHKPQGKLVTCLHGELLDAVVDLRPNSATFGQHKTILLTSQNRLQLYVPPGFAHGFYTLSDMATLFYKCTDYYDPADEGGLAWNDPTINIEWPQGERILSEKDQKLPLFESQIELFENIWSHL